MIDCFIWEWTWRNFKDMNRVIDIFIFVYHPIYRCHILEWDSWDFLKEEI